ncbi:MAG TPA: regulatory protein RecX [Chloroflexota bacterium]|nr:regulatory protein RecX [Chloroflexota bacterium]
MRASAPGASISAISHQRRARSGRVNVAIDGAFAFSLAVPIAASVRAGDPVDEATVNALLRRDEQERAHERALRFLATRPRSEAEVRRRLARAGYSPQAADATANRLKAEGLVDDDAFAAYWVSQRMTFHPRGPRALRAELRAKGVDATRTSAAIEPIQPSQALQAYRAALRRAERLCEPDERRFVHDLIAYLARRGFDYGPAREAVALLWKEHGEIPSASSVP